MKFTQVCIPTPCWLHVSNRWEEVWILDSEVKNNQKIGQKYRERYYNCVTVKKNSGKSFDEKMEESKPVIRCGTQSDNITYLIYDTGHLIKKKTRILRTCQQRNFPKNDGKSKWSIRYFLWILDISSLICLAFLLNLKKWMGCLITPFEICFHIWIFEPPWFIILQKREIADGKKSSSDLRNWQILNTKMPSSKN